ncbi:MAG TPA: hypothetical protein VK551_02220, partial [Thermodesulfobacteriota bacterium]|nr:hypothetical protein [Thermodesulfobacteriota bacterium]
MKRKSGGDPTFFHAKKALDFHASEWTCQFPSHSLKIIKRRTDMKTKKGMIFVSLLAVTLCVGLIGDVWAQK